MIIGITGKSGSGKSTLAEYLSEKLPKNVILTVDRIVQDLIIEQREILVDLFGKEIIKENKINTILFIKYPEKQKKLFDIVNNDLIEILLKKLRNEKYVNQYDYIIVDYFKLPLLQEIWNLCDIYILVEAINDQERYYNIALRNKKMGRIYVRNVDEELRLRDYYIPNYYDYCYDYIIKNKYDVSLKKEVDSISDEIFHYGKKRYKK